MVMILYGWDDGVLSALVSGSLGLERCLGVWVVALVFV